VPVRALLFDLDNTLVPEFPNYERAFDAACIAAAQRYSFDLSEFREHVFARSLALWDASETSAFCADLGIGSPTSLLSDFPGERPEFRRLRDWAPAYRRRCWIETLGPLVPRSDVDELAAHLDQAFRAELRANCPPYDDVPKIVEALASRYTVAVLYRSRVGRGRFRQARPTLVHCGT
jgi:putative hydrolase of the HAD superfamily